MGGDFGPRIQNARADFASASRTLFIFLYLLLFILICTIEYFIKIQGLPYGVSLSLAPCIFLKSSIRRNCKGDELILDKVSSLAIAMEENKYECR